MIYSTAETPTPVHINARSLAPLHYTGRVTFVLVTCMIGLFALAEGSFSIFITFCLFALIGFLISSTQGATATNLFLFVYAVSAVAAILLYTIYMDRYGTPYYGGGSDDLHYEEWGQDTAQRLGIFDYGSIRGTIVQPFHNSVGYVYLVSLFYRLGELLGGFHTMIPRLFNCMLLGMTTVISYRLAWRLLMPKRMALMVGLAVGLMPIMVYNSVHTFRDVLVSLLLLIGVYLWTPNLQSPHRGLRILHWSVTLLLVLLLSQVRFFQSLILLGVALVGDVFATQQRSPLRQRLYIVLIMLAVIVLLVILSTQVVDIVTRLAQSQENYADYRTGLSDGLAVYVFTTPPPIGYILRIGYALISPLPVPSLQPDRLLLSLGTTLQFFFLPFLGFGLLWAIKNRSLWPLLSAFVVLFGGMAFLTFTDRHIVQFFPYGVILVAAGYLQYQRYRISIWFLLAWLGALLALAYILLKYIT